MRTVYRQKLSLKYTDKCELKGDSVSNCWHSHYLIKQIWDKDELALVEHFNVLYLDAANKPVCWAEIARGGFDKSTVDVRLVLTHAILSNATNMILAHNHPHGNTTPSESDLHLTKLIMAAAATLGLKVLDHLILTPAGKIFSFAQEGLLK